VIKFASLDPADRLEVFKVVAGPPRRMLPCCLGEFYGLGIDLQDAKDAWRAEQELGQTGPAIPRGRRFQAVRI